MNHLPDFYEGDALTAAWVNEVSRRLNGLQQSAGDGVEVGPWGLQLTTPDPETLWIKVLEVADTFVPPRHAFEQVYHDDAGALARVPSGVVGTLTDSWAERIGGGAAEVGALALARKDAKGRWLFVEVKEPEEAYVPTPRPGAPCLEWYTAYHHLGTVSVAVGEVLPPRATIGQVKPYPIGAHHHFSLGDGDKIFDTEAYSIAGQTVDVGPWLTEDHGFATTGTRDLTVPGPDYVAAYSPEDLAYIRARFAPPVEPTAAWVLRYGSTAHKNHDYYAQDIYLQAGSFTDQMEAGQVVRLAVAEAADDIESVVVRAEQITPDVGFCVVVRHRPARGELACPEEPDEQDDDHTFGGRRMFPLYPDSGSAACDWCAVSILTRLCVTRDVETGFLTGVYYVSPSGVRVEVAECTVTKWWCAVYHSPDGSAFDLPLGVYGVPTGDSLGYGWTVVGGPFDTEAEADASCAAGITTACCPSDDIPRLMCATVASSLGGSFAVPVEYDDESGHWKSPPGVVFGPLYQNDDFGYIGVHDFDIYCGAGESGTDWQMVYQLAYTGGMSPASGNAAVPEPTAATCAPFSVASVVDDPYAAGETLTVTFAAGACAAFDKAAYLAGIPYTLEAWNPLLITATGFPEDPVAIETNGSPGGWSNAPAWSNGLLNEYGYHIVPNWGLPNGVGLGGGATVRAPYMVVMADPATYGPLFFLNIWYDDGVSGEVGTAVQNDTYTASPFEVTFDCGTWLGAVSPGPVTVTVTTP